MTTTPWLIIAIIILALLFIFLAWTIKKGKKRPPDYYTFFWMGIIWLIFGIPFKNYALSAMGLIFTLVGLVNRSKWEENRVRWQELTAEEKKIRMIIMIALGILLIAGIIFYFLFDRGII